MSTELPLTGVPHVKFEMLHCLLCFCFLGLWTEIPPISLIVGSILRTAGQLGNRVIGIGRILSAMLSLTG